VYKFYFHRVLFHRKFNVDISKVVFQQKINIQTKTRQFMKLNMIKLSLVSLFCISALIACNSLENEGGKDWIQVEVTLEQPDNNSALRAYSAASVQSALIIAVPITVTEAEYEALDSAYDTQLQNLTDNTVSLTVPLNESIKLLRAAYSDVYTLDQVIASKPTPYALGFSAEFTVTASDEEKTITIQMQTTESWEGTLQYGSTGTRDYGANVVVASDGSIYIAGSARGHLDDQTNVNSGTDDMFVSKVAADGSKQWTRMFGSTLNENTGGAAVDGSGNVYITGFTGSDAAIDSNTNQGAKDVFVAKYSSSGVKSFIYHYGTAADEGGEAIMVGSDNKIYVVGWSQSANFGNTTTDSGVNDPFIMKIDLDGTNPDVLVQEDITDATGDVQTDRLNDAVMDSNDNIYIIGSTVGRYVSSSPDNFDAYVGKYSASGTRAWDIQIGGGGWDDIGEAIAVDSSGNVYIACENRADNIMGEVPNQGETDIFILVLL